MRDECPRCGSAILEGGACLGCLGIPPAPDPRQHKLFPDVPPPSEQMSGIARAAILMGNAVQNVSDWLALPPSIRAIALEAWDYEKAHPLAPRLLSDWVRGIMKTRDKGREERGSVDHA